MAYTAKFLHPIRQSLTVMSSSCSSFNHFYYGRIYSIKALLKSFQPSLCLRASVFQPSVDIGGHFLRNVRISGKKISSGAILSISIAFGPITARAMDAGDALVDPFEDSQDLSEEEEHPLEFWKFAKKYWLPVFLLLNVLANLDDPIILLFIKVALFLLSTKPNPLSVYVSIDQLCQEFQSHKVKCLYASKVEVQDYKLLCLANVEDVESHLVDAIIVLCCLKKASPFPSLRLKIPLPTGEHLSPVCGLSHKLFLHYYDTKEYIFNECSWILP